MTRNTLRLTVKGIIGAVVGFSAPGFYLQFGTSWISAILFAGAAFAGVALLVFPSVIPPDVRPDQMSAHKKWGHWAASVLITAYVLSEIVPRIGVGYFAAAAFVVVSVWFFSILARPDLHADRVSAARKWGYLVSSVLVAAYLLYQAMSLSVRL